VVIDANVLVSAIFGGTPERAVRRAFEEEVWVSGDIKKELKGLGDKLRKKLTLPQIVRWNRSFLPLIGEMRLARVRRKARLSRDPDDDAYLSLALAARADFLITGDEDLSSLSLGELRGAGLGFLSIVSPREFLERTGGE
jgi:putative PIN family toxin of toxin-antitoxin system